MLKKINFQSKTKPLAGQISFCEFENENTGLKRNIFHSVIIPFTEFDAGLRSEPRFESPELTVEWIILNLQDNQRLSGISVSHNELPDMEASIYLDGAHNRCRVDLLHFTETQEPLVFEVEIRLMCFFEDEGVALNENIEVVALAKLDLSQSTSGN